MKNFSAIPALLIAVGSCASPATTATEDPARFKLLVVDEESKMEFRVEFKSEDTRKICFEVEQWPSASGSLDSGSQSAWLVTNERNIPAFDDNFGYCPGGCGLIQVDAGKSLIGRITYSQFGSADEISRMAVKKLRFDIYPKICRPEMKIVEPR
jgi:hypothetical protein